VPIGLVADMLDRVRKSERPPALARAELGGASTGDCTRRIGLSTAGRSGSRKHGADAGAKDLDPWCDWSAAPRRLSACQQGDLLSR